MNYNNLIKKYKTPFFVYDIDILKQRINYIKSKLNYKIIYAVKANTFILPYIDELVDGYEICSFGEFEICNKLNLPSHKFIISGVNKDKKSIEYMIKKYDDLKYTIESYNQYKMLCNLAKKYNRKINVLIRLSSNNQFGVSETDFEKIVSLKNTNINILGLEYFSGTQKESIKKINKEIDYIISFVDYIEKKYNIVLEEIEYGTGSKVSYFINEEFDEETYFNNLNTALSKTYKKVSLEIGRSIVASCGFYFTKVADLKTNKNDNIAILDGGINHLVYYGQTMAMRIPYFDLYNKKSGIKKIYTLYGSLCTINDIIIKNIELTKLSIGDVFIFKNTGAYSSTEGINLFLSRELPKIIINKDGNNYLVRNNIKTSKINCPKERKCV